MLFKQLAKWIVPTFTSFILLTIDLTKDNGVCPFAKILFVGQCLYMALIIWFTFCLLGKYKINVLSLKLYCYGNFFKAINWYGNFFKDIGMEMSLKPLVWKGL